ncbi:hypothetical protein AAZX31_04G198600 [Glycine max]|uniref:Uncharacterized protein n=2 Tax=Glycine subgen. Soja TaxID=1462606 RepID=K7KLK2_SOYBN|nr:uncharacterized protein LOC114408225 [Glycine soja]XP_040870939.1 uncharacterized protein LOC121174797 [Glycine max]KAH1112556.1 hypothetical protein GYH30_010700 [Glycine max]KRH64123.1 hypothetical protein GLYMA_04G217700v4 [Glycine max]
MENLRQVVDAGEVKRLSNESGGGGLVVEPLAVVVDATGGQAGVEDVENLLTILSLRRCHHTFGSANRFSLSQILKPINSLLLMEEKGNLTHYKIRSLPTLFYVPDFITNSDQILLLKNVVLTLILLPFVRRN